MEIETENGLKLLLDNISYTASIIKSPNVKGKILVPIFIQHENQDFKITSIQDDAFAHSNIDSLEFPPSSQMISFGKYIFKYSHIKKIQIPSSLTTIDPHCFSLVNDLTDIEVSPDNKNFAYINNQLLVGKSDPSLDIFDSIYLGRADLEELIVPPYIKFILDDSLRGCIKLKKIIFTEDSALEELSFSDISSKIKKIVLPKNINFIYGDFSDFDELTDIEIPPENKKYKFIDKKFLITKKFLSEKFDDLLFVPHNIEKLTIPKYISNINDKAIHSKKLKILDFEEDSQLTCIDYNWFESLEKFTIPKNLKFFSAFSFQQNSSLKEVVISPENQTFKFADDNDKLILTKGVKSQQFDEIFLCIRDAKEITIPSYIKKIGPYSIQWCNELKTISFEKNSNLKYIGIDNFRCCSKLESIVFPNLKNFRFNATFNNLENLKYVKILADEVSYNAGYDLCYNLELISFPNALKVDFKFNSLQEKTKIEIREDAQLTGDISKLDKNRIVYIRKNSASNNKDQEIETSDKGDKKTSLNETEKNQSKIQMNIKDQKKQQETEIKELQNKMKNQETEIKEQKKKIEELEKRIKQREIEIREQNILNEELEKRIKQQETEIKEKYKNEHSKQEEEYEKQINEQESENNELKNQILQLKKQISTQQPSQPKISSFSNMIIFDSEMIHNLRIISDIGRGSAGKVVKIGKEELYAMKIMNIEEGNNFENFKHFINEYELLNMLNHPNIIKVHGIFYGDENTAPSILMEYCPNNLDNIIKAKQINNYERAIYIYQIAEGFKYIHFKGIIHRDIKPQNILIGCDGLIKICDFGISKFVSNEDSSTMTLGIGTQKFMAPEIINEEKQYSEKVDVYSFGVLIFYILCGKMPEITIGKIANGIKAEIPNTVNEFGKKLINLCWSFEPQSRPSFNEICIMLKEANYDLVELSRLEKQELIIFVNKHNQNIPNYEETRSSILPKIKSFKSTLPQMSLYKFSTQKTKIPKSIINRK